VWQKRLRGTVIATPRELFFISPSPDGCFIRAEKPKGGNGKGQAGEYMAYIRLFFRGQKNQGKEVTRGKKRKKAGKGNGGKLSWSESFSSV
jgi:hypothetical protein